MDNVIIYDKLEELNEGIEYNGGGITSLLGKGCVKSVQRGSASYSCGSKPDTKTIATVSSVDVTKSIVLFSASCYVQSNLSWNYFAASISFDGQHIALTGNHPNTQAYINWQVVEFY